MATKQMNATWRRVRDRIQDTWSDVDFDEKNMRRTRGSLSDMVTLIHERTGEPRQDVRRKVIAVL